MRRRLLALGASAALIAGCGGSGSSEADPAEGEIRSTLDALFVDEPTKEACADLYTEAFLKEAAPKGTDDPLEYCEKSSKTAIPSDSIEVADLEIDGPSASVTVTPAGGDEDGTVLELALVDDDGWKVDTLEGVEIASREAVNGAISRQIALATGKDAERQILTGKDSDCVTEYFETEVSDAELQKALLEQETPYLYDALRECLGGGTDLIALTTISVNQLIGEGLTREQAECTAGAGIAGLKGDVTLEEYLASDKARKRYEDAIVTGASFCLGA